MLNIEQEQAALEQLGTNDLQTRYAEVYGESTRGRHKRWLIKRILWRVQALAEGDLSERARRRAEELAKSTDIRTTTPRSPKTPSQPRHKVIVQTSIVPDGRLPPPGTVLMRSYKGATVEVLVLANGFEYQGAIYGSLSAVAKAITGSHCNGYHFFRLKGANP